MCAPRYEGACKRYHVLWSLPPSPFPPGFPPLYATPAATPTCLQPRHLSFVIGADHAHAAAPSYGLFVFACSAQLQALKVRPAHYEG